MTYSCELKARKVQVFIEKTHDGHILPVTDVEVLDAACGTNHVVRGDLGELPTVHGLWRGQSSVM